MVLRIVATTLYLASLNSVISSCGRSHKRWCTHYFMDVGPCLDLCTLAPRDIPFPPKSCSRSPNTSSIYLSHIVYLAVKRHSVFMRTAILHLHTRVIRMNSLRFMLISQLVVHIYGTPHDAWLGTHFPDSRFPEKNTSLIHWLHAVFGKWGANCWWWPSMLMDHNRLTWRMAY